MDENCCCDDDVDRTSVSRVTLQKARFVQKILRKTSPVKYETYKAVVVSLKC